MANPLEADSAEVAAEPVMKSATTETKKRAPKARKVKTERRQSARPNDAATTASKAEEIIAPTMRTGRKIYSEKERAHKLGQIEKSIGRGGTLKAAVKEVGITEQTYYHWKKAAAGPVEGDGLKDLVALEEENKRLKGLLAAQLRKENAELKKRLGL
ncbi:transcriptional regulator [Mesorhizobium sp. WSM3876]|nr:transcriptional regulator [Mesorhizobium sp. WSM3876]